MTTKVPSLNVRISQKCDSTHHFILYLYPEYTIYHLRIGRHFKNNLSKKKEKF